MINPVFAPIINDILNKFHKTWPNDTEALVRMIPELAFAKNPTVIGEVVVNATLPTTPPSATPHPHNVADEAARLIEQKGKMSARDLSKKFGTHKWSEILVPFIEKGVIDAFKNWSQTEYRRKGYAGTFGTGGNDLDAKCRLFRRKACLLLLERGLDRVGVDASLVTTAEVFRLESDPETLIKLQKKGIPKIFNDLLLMGVLQRVGNDHGNGVYLRCVDSRRMEEYLKSDSFEKYEMPK